MKTELDHNFEMKDTDEHRWHALIYLITAMVLSVVIGSIISPLIYELTYHVKK